MKFTYLTRLYCVMTVLFVFGNNPAYANQYLNGIDVSHHQGKIDWAAVKESGIHFAIVKSTGGETYIDPEFYTNWNGIREAELYRGAYHFFYAGDSAEAQAKNYLSVVKQLRPNDLPPIVDVEILDNETTEILVERLVKWLAIVEQILGKIPVIYTSPNFANKHLIDSRLQRYPLWIADYGVQQPSIPQNWETNPPLFWQHTEKGKTPGVPHLVDQNYFMKPIVAFKKFLEHSTVD